MWISTLSLLLTAFTYSAGRIPLFQTHPNIIIYYEYVRFAVLDVHILHAHFDYRAISESILTCLSSLWQIARNFFKDRVRKSYFYLCPCKLNAGAIWQSVCVYGNSFYALMLSLCGVFLHRYICFATDAFVKEYTLTFECNSMRRNFTHLNVFFVVSTVLKYTYAHIVCCMGCIWPRIYHVFHLCKLLKHTSSSELRR